MTPCYQRHELAPGVHVDIPHEHEGVPVKTMAEVIGAHAVAGMSGGTHIACRCNRAWVLHSEYREHLEAILTAAGFGPVKAAAAGALRDAADALDELWNLRKVRMGECRDWADGVEESEALLRDRTASIEAQP